MTNILEEFKALYDAHIEEIREADNRASDAVHKVTDLCEKYGIPYYANISPLSQTFRPGSYDEKQRQYEKWVETLTEEEKEALGDGYGLEDDLMTQVSGDWPGKYEGWQHSGVC